MKTTAPNPDFLYAPETINLIFQAGQAMRLAESPEPDVWWGENGIDALIWGDDVPYADPCPDAAEPDGPPCNSDDEPTGSDAP